MEAWENSGLPVLPLGQQRLLGKDLLQAAKETEMGDVYGGPGGQSAALVTEIKSAQEVVEDMVEEALYYLKEVLPGTTSTS